MPTAELPSFDLVVATVTRVDELDRLLESLERQAHERFAVYIVDQNRDGRLQRVLAAHAALDIAHLRAEPGLSRARNVGLEHVTADVVAFPDDDCVYPGDLLERVGRRLVDDPSLDGICGRVADAEGRASASWKTDAALLTDDDLWNRANSCAVFLRRAVVERVGGFDEQLGLGSSGPWSSAEEIDYLVRAVRRGARIAFDPTVVVEHEVRPDDVETGARDGASVGYILRKHSFPARTLVRMLVRPLGGALLALARRDGARARYYLATVRGRLTGYRGASPSNSSRWRSSQGSSA